MLLSRLALRGIDRMPRVERLRREQGGDIRTIIDAEQLRRGGLGRLHLNPVLLSLRHQAVVALPFLARHIAGGLPLRLDAEDVVLGFAKVLQGPAQHLAEFLGRRVGGRLGSPRLGDDLAAAGAVRSRTSGRAMRRFIRASLRGVFRFVLRDGRAASSVGEREAWASRYRRVLGEATLPGG